MTNAKQFAVIYRTGGTDNFRWNRVLDTFTREEAANTASNLARMGYPALVHNADRLNAIGLPDTFSAEDSPEGAGCYLYARVPTSRHSHLIPFFCREVD